jgi:hypothetical protein
MWLCIRLFVIFPLAARESAHNNGFGHLPYKRSDFHDLAGMRQANVEVHVFLYAINCVHRFWDDDDDDDDDIFEFSSYISWGTFRLALSCHSLYLILIYIYILHFNCV